MKNTLPTVFHITHPKAGSQWVAEILKRCAPGRFVPWTISDPYANDGRGTPSFELQPLIPGQIYGTVYLNRQRFRSIVTSLVWGASQWILFGRLGTLRNGWNYRIRRRPCRAFVILRDLRDTLVSYYFSTRFSHEATPAIIVRRKQRLNDLSQEEGLRYLLDDALPRIASIQTSWIAAPGVPVLRYEDILGNEQVFFEQLAEHCQILVGRERLASIVGDNMFDAIAGRNRGEEDMNAHLRKGVAGDWRGHFSGDFTLEFKKRYGQLLIDTGYEKDMNW